MGPDSERELAEEREQQAQRVEQHRVAVESAEKNAPERSPASVLSEWIKGYQQLDVLQSTSERRFASALYDLNHYINGLGRDLREARRTTIEGECTEPTSGGGHVTKGQVGGREGTALSVDRSRNDSVTESSKAVQRKRRPRADGSENASGGAGRRKPRGIQH